MRNFILTVLYAASFAYAVFNTDSKSIAVMKGTRCGGVLQHASERHTEDSCLLSEDRGVEKCRYWDSDESKCYTGEIYRFNKATATSVIKLDQLETQNYGSLVLKHNGPTVRYGNLHVALDCFHLCQKHRETCKFYRYNVSSYDCILMGRSVWIAPKAATDKKIISGSASGVVADFKCSTGRKDMDYFGYDIEGLEAVQTRDAEECQRRCTGIPGSKAFTWAHHSENCYCKSEAEGLRFQPFSCAGLVGDLSVAGW